MPGSLLGIEVTTYTKSSERGLPSQVLKKAGPVCSSGVWQDAHCPANVSDPRVACSSVYTPDMVVRGLAVVVSCATPVSASVISSPAAIGYTHMIRIDSL